MNQLYLLQFACCLVSVALALMLVISRFQMRWIHQRYETSRWLMAFAYAMLALHFVLQMEHGIRAKSDEMGAIVNILYYTPIALLISYGTYNVVCSRTRGRHRYIVTSSLVYLLMLVIFGIGCIVNGITHLGIFIYLLLGLFLGSIFYCFSVNILEMRRHRKMMEEDSGADMLPYDRYTWASYIMMGVSVIALVGGIINRPVLFYVGPLMLLSLFVFTMSFIAYGYNIMPTDVMLEETEAEEENLEMEDDSPAADEEVVGPEVVSVPEKLQDEQAGVAPALDADRTQAIEEALQNWRDKGGFSDSTLNMISLSKKLRINREDLSAYFDSYIGTTFRVWLSDIRFQEAQRMLRDNPRLSNDNISLECGFSSHAHLYKIFKIKTGMTPGQWKETLE